MAAVFKVLPKGGAMVADYEAMAGGSRRFHGWTFDNTVGDSAKDPNTGRTIKAGAFARQSNVLTVPRSAEYSKHLRGDPRRGGHLSADLWPADKETADAVNVPFDPTFGGEHPRVDVPAPVVPVVPSAVVSAAPSVSTPSVSTVAPVKAGS